MPALEPVAPARFVPFSLFHRDWFNRVFGALGMDGRRAGVLLRCVALVGVTWVPMAVLAAAQGLVGTTIDARNFFADYAAYA